MWITKLQNGMWCAKAKGVLVFGYSLDVVIGKAVDYLIKRGQVLSTL